MLLHGCFYHILNTIDVPSIALCKFSTDSNETTGDIMGVCQLLGTVLAVEFERDWASGHGFERLIND
jgi:hypothetical protein